MAVQVVARRRRRGLSQGQLAERLAALGYPKLDRSALSKLETGKRRIGVDDLFALAAALEVAPVFLLAPAAPGAVAVVPEVEVDGDLLKLWFEGWEALPGSSRESRSRYFDEMSPREVWGASNPHVRRLGRLFDRIYRAIKRGSGEGAEDLYNSVVRDVERVIRRGDRELDGVMPEQEQDD
jgi:transcriptional regulator with XRE-family HTH domain